MAKNIDLKELLQEGTNIYPRGVEPPITRPYTFVQKSIFVTHVLVLRRPITIKVSADGVESAIDVVVKQAKEYASFQDGVMREEDGNYVFDGTSVRLILGSTVPFLSPEAAEYLNDPLSTTLKF